MNEENVDGYRQRAVGIEYKVDSRVSERKSISSSSSSACNVFHETFPRVAEMQKQNDVYLNLS